MAGLGKKTVEDIQVKGKKCIVRCDFNVPVKDGVITDDKRIREALKTVKYLKENGAKVILCSHMGRPKGEFNMKYSLAPVAERISELMGCPVAMATDVIGEDAKAKVAALNDGDIMLLENLRFHKEEEKNAPEFAKAYTTPIFYIAPTFFLLLLPVVLKRVFVQRDFPIATKPLILT